MREALLDLETVPSGSVHYFPVTYEQYMALLNRDEGGGPNCAESDPLIRDYLLCDGRRYLTRDFPELAKILNGEVVSYERPYNITDQKTLTAPSEDPVSYVTGADADGNAIISEISNGQSVGDTTRLRRFRHTNGKNDVFYAEILSGNNEPMKVDCHTFRVPDLRHLFPKSCIFASSRTDSIALEEYNKAGSYHVDSLPRGKRGDSARDDHYHFTFFGSYLINFLNPYPTSCADNSQIRGGAIPYDTGQGLVLGPHVNCAKDGIMGLSFDRAAGGSFAILTNNSWWIPLKYSFAGHQVRDRNTSITCVFRSPNPKYYLEGRSRCCHLFGIHNTSYYIITSPGKAIDNVPDTGTTSVNISRFGGETLGDKQFGSDASAEISNSIMVQNPVSYCQESTPRYVGFLPLIKI